jgi:DNA ligase D-like protein (predicted polymerase)/DNA ligase D-like protein (predicted 3'-phosphoesterase)
LPGLVGLRPGDDAGIIATGDDRRSAEGVDVARGLEEYRRRRDAGRTPEPVPAHGQQAPGGDGDLFVVQEHHARRLHYDVRLERDGVLVSWAVPRGLPREAGAVRLAVRTEDHPMEYARFEGEIPRGEYGAGQVTIWDHGRYETLKWTDDEIQVVLHGERVDATFVFFRSADGDRRDWMVRRRGEPGAAGRAGPAGPAQVRVRVDDRQLTLTNLDKVLYPEDGFSKAEVIDYYRRIAPLLLPHLAGRPVTFRRYPDGVDGPSFYEKDVSRHAPSWIRTAAMPTPDSVSGRAHTSYPLIDDLPGLIWAANLAALELHVPQWRLTGRGTAGPPDLLVFDLDPGAPATVVECCRVAELIRVVLARDGLTGFPKTSGSKGMQVTVPVRVRDPARTAGYAQALARELAHEHPTLVVAVMAKSRRAGRVFVDWDQNRPAKTTIAPYSLRAREHPTVSTPVSWAEVRRCRRPEDLVFTAGQVLARVGRRGGLWAGLPDAAARLPR